MAQPKRKRWLIWLVVLLLLHGPVGGVVTQTTVSAASYLGVSIASIFVPQIRNDLSAINYNPFNTDAEKTLTAQKVSFYRGVAIYKTTINRSGSFAAVLLDHNANENALKHEFGHTRQLLLTGPLTYLLMIGVPSYFETSNRPYYERPWEVTADQFGGVTARPSSTAARRTGNAYLAVSATLGPVGYFFLINEF